MEILIIILLSFISVCLIVSLNFIVKICDTLFDSAELNRQNQEKIDIIKNIFLETSDQVILLESKIERLQLALKEPQSPNPPIKPNNWDSMRKVFKAPTKGDSLNE